MVGKTAVAVFASEVPVEVPVEVADEDDAVAEDGRVAEDDADNVTNDEVDPDADPDETDAAAVVAPMLCSARSTILVRRSFSASLARSDARSICAANQCVRTSQHWAKMKESGETTFSTKCLRKICTAVTIDPIIVLFLLGQNDTMVNFAVIQSSDSSDR